MLKENKGVTLVALVITIIVLLILAGVTLSMVMGDSGIFGKANNAKLSSLISDAKEAVNLAAMEATAAQYDDKDGSATYITSADVYTKVSPVGYTIDGTSHEVKKDGESIVDANGDKLTVTLTVTDKHGITTSWTGDKIEKNQ